MENATQTVGVELTPKQSANLRKLANYLDKLPADYAHFKMASYVADYQCDDYEARIIREYEVDAADTMRLRNCGTCACAVGHGPLARIKPKAGETWLTYEERAFGVSQPHDAWRYLFGPENVDDAKAAARRIRRFLANDCRVPE